MKTTYSDETIDRCKIIQLLIAEGNKTMLTINNLIGDGHQRDGLLKTDAAVQIREFSYQLHKEIATALEVARLLNTDSSSWPDVSEDLISDRSQAAHWTGLNVDLLTAILNRAHGVAMMLYHYLGPHDVFLGYEMISNVTWDIGGRLSEAKNLIDDAIQPLSEAA